VTSRRNDVAARVSLPGSPRAPRRLPLPTARPTGRRPREEVQRAALEATLDLVDNPSIGYRGLTMEAVARRAGISKATLYRWWPSKAHLLCEAYVAKANRDIPLPGAGDLGEDLREYLHHIAFALGHLGTGRTIAEVILAANVDPAFGDLYRHTLLADRKRSLRHLLERARAAGQLRADADLEVVVDMAYGALHHRLVVSHEPIDGPYVAGLATLLARALVPLPGDQRGDA